MKNVARVEDLTLQDSVVELDGTDFQNVHFKNCTLVYRGGNTSFVGCEFFDPKFQFLGEADYTLGFLASIYESGGGAFLDQMMESLRGNYTPRDFGAKPSDN